MTETPDRDEDALRTARRDALAVLLSRARRGVLTADEAQLLQQHVETEMRDADQAARGHGMAEIKREGEKMRADKHWATVQRVRALADRWQNALAPDLKYAHALRAALAEPKEQ